MSDIAKTVLDALDKAIADNQEDGMRTHLGASVIGRLCDREIWYSFRWAKPVKHSARMCRLFDRGHKEEFRFEDWIAPICDKFWPLHPETGEQIRISDFEGHFGGSLDGIVRNPAGLKGDFLTEFKTHNDKSYEKLNMKGVKEAKPEHYVQMQIYLKKHPKLDGALYFAINKNTDAMYVEFVERDDETADEYMARAARLLQSREPPERHRDASTYHFYCKYFCDYTDICHNNATPAKNCRTCAHFELRPNKEYMCGKHGEILSVDKTKVGCEDYVRGF